MGRLHLISLSEASGNDIDAQRWLLHRMSNNVQYLCKVTHTTMDSTFGDLSTLINKLCNLYAATGCDFHKLNKLLQEKLDEAEADYEPESIKSAQEDWANRPYQFDTDSMKLEATRGDELMQRPLRFFFRPRRGA